MKVPEPRKLTSGKYFIQMRLGGESVTVSSWRRKDCILDAQAIKADWLAKKRLPPKDPQDGLTLTKAIDQYLEQKSCTLSPSTMRGYRAIQKHRFPGLMSREVRSIADDEWQGILNAEAAVAAPKTVRNAFLFVRGVIWQTTGHQIPMDRLTLPAIPPPDTAFLQPEEIPKFVAQIKGTRVAVAALLALSSLRISEISALMWEDIPEDPKFIRVAGAVVRGTDTAWVRKKQTKNASSTRNVPILIPELTEAIKRDRKEAGPVMDYDQDTLRVQVHKACQDAGITDVTIHGLRHSFASLAYHLRIPERITMEMGGWSDPTTMHKTYTHIAQSDIARYRTALESFYRGENANKNANNVEKR